VGCGSGILSAAALKLGATHALGVDIDPRAVEVSLENAALNGVTESYEAGIGSVHEILRGDFSIRSAPLVLANILAPILIRLFDDGLGDLVAPRGTLILSGILEPQAEDVLQAAAAHGFELSDRKQIADWVALALRRA
jgi:ribosomal protein L11 methyltransferase